MNNKKYIFLDIDGPLITTRSMLAFGKFPNADPVAISILKRIVEKNDANLIISSSWRFGTEWRKDITKLLCDNGFSPSLCTGYLLDRTPTHLPSKLNKSISRGDEIWAWMLTMELHNLAPYTEYIIFDDDRDFFEWQPLLHVNRDIGLGIKEVELLKGFGWKFYG